jgi:hypothetical protein
MPSGREPFSGGTYTNRVPLGWCFKPKLFETDMGKRAEYLCAGMQSKME